MTQGYFLCLTSGNKKSSLKMPEEENIRKPCFLGVYFNTSEDLKKIFIGFLNFLSEENQFSSPLVYLEMSF